MADRIIEGGKTGTVEGVNNDVTIYPFDPFLDPDGLENCVRWGHLRS